MKMEQSNSLVVKIETVALLYSIIAAGNIQSKNQVAPSEARNF